MPELTARLRLIADIRNFASNIQRGAQQAKTALGGLDRQVGNVGVGLNGANKASKSFFQTLRSNVGTQIKAGIMFATLYQALITFRQTIGAAIAELFNLDEALRKVQSISKDTDAAIAALNDQLLKAARQGRLYGQTAAEVAVGMFEIVQAGFDTAEAFEIATVAAQAASAGFTDAATAGKVITGALLAFGMEADKARYVANVLFQTVDTGVVTFEQLAQGLGVAMSPAALLNVSLEELGAAVALMTRKGIPANRAMTSLTRILFAFLDPSDKAFKAAANMGFALDAQTVKTHGLLGAMQLLNEATGGNEELLADVFDRQRALVGAFSLLADGGEDWAEILALQNRAQEEAGALTSAWNERMKALTIRMSILRAQVLALVVQGFQPLAKGLGVVVDWMSRMISDEMGVFKWLKDTATGVTGLSDAWNGFTRALKETFTEGSGGRLQLMFWGMFVVLREGIPVLFELLALLLRVGTWALRNKPALIAIALAFGAMFVAAHPLLAVFQALLILTGYMEKNWDDWRVRIGGTTAVVLLAVVALNLLWSAFTASRLAMSLFNTNLAGVTAGTGLLRRALMNMAAGVKNTFTPMINSFILMRDAAARTATQVWRVADGLANILMKPVNIARTVTVTTVQKAGEAAAEVGKVGTEAVKKGIASGLVQGLAKGIGAGVGAAIIAGIVLAVKVAVVGLAAALGVSVGAVVLIIVAVLLAALIAGFLIYKYRNEIWAGLKTLGRVLKEFFTTQLPEYLKRYFLEPLQEFFTNTLPAWAKQQFTATNMGRWFGRFLMSAILLVFWPAALAYKFRDKLNAFVQAITGFLAELPGKIASKIGDAAGAIIGQLVDAAKWGITFEKNVLEFEASIIAFMAELPGKIAAFIGDHWKDILDFLVDAAKWYIHFELKIAEFILKAAQTMIALPGKIAAYIGDHWKEIITFLVSPEDWWNLFKTLVEEFVDLVTEKVGPLLAGIGTAIGGGIRSAIATALSGLGSFLENTLRAGLSWLTKVGGPLVSVLDFFGAVPSGMKDVIRWLEGGGGGGETFGPPSPQQQRNRGLLGFARGVRNFAGGLAMVGERGAELVRLPRGSDVFRRADVGQALRGAAGGGTSVSAEVNITTSLLKDFLELKRLLLKEVDQKLDDAAARVGMTKPRYGTWGVGQSRI
jgi:TP901 family phage tail tape measure protein